MEEKIKHLEFIQNVISRLSHKSFLVKSWSITTLAAICAFGIEKQNSLIFILGIPVSLLFWYLDSKYLMLERCFRKLYNKVRKDKVNSFSMKISNSKDIKMHLKTAFGHTVAPIYLLELLLCIGGMIYYFFC